MVPLITFDVGKWEWILAFHFFWNKSDLKRVFWHFPAFGDAWPWPRVRIYCTYIAQLLFICLLISCRYIHHPCLKTHRLVFASAAMISALGIQQYRNRRLEPYRLENYPSGNWWKAFKCAHIWAIFGWHLKCLQMGLELKMSTYLGNNILNFFDWIILKCIYRGKKVENGWLKG